jgi:hypothetical protein
MSILNDDNFIHGNITFADANGGPYTISSGTGGPYTIGAGAVGTGYTWNTNTSAVDWSIGTSINKSATMELRGDNADILVNGRSLMNAIDALEQRLNIMVPNPELEKEWDELKELGDRYRALEQQCKEKGEMWAKLKEIKK